MYILRLSPLPGDRAANLDICLAFMASSSEGLFHATTTAIQDFSFTVESSLFVGN
jgi:hypothetical protein